MKRLIVGQPLYTKDGRVYSNASIICVGNRGKSITYQIVTEHGNDGILLAREVEENFYLYSPDDDEQLPLVDVSPSGTGSLTVSKQHADNIAKVIPEDLFKRTDLKDVSVLKVDINDWEKFSELLCLGNDV